MEIYAIKRDDGKYFYRYQSTNLSECQPLWRKEIIKVKDNDSSCFDEVAMFPTIDWAKLAKDNLEKYYDSTCSIVPITIIEDTLDEHNEKIRLKEIEKLFEITYEFITKAAIDLDFEIYNSQSTTKECQQRINTLKEKLMYMFFAEFKDKYKN